MNKLWMITAREYTSRVKKKSFIFTTILAPIGFIVFWVALIFIMSSGQENKEVVLVDPDKVLQTDAKGKLKDGSITFKYSNKDVDVLKESFREEGYDGVLYVPSQRLDSVTRTLNVIYYSDEDLGLKSKDRIKKSLEQQARKIKMDQLALSQKRLDRLETDIQLKTPSLVDGKEEEESNFKAEIATALGFAMMILIYFIIFTYGNMVMRSVMEEKTNRIVEVLISSVKPFQLMLGKVIGVGAVGLTQFAIWALVMPLLYMGVGLLFADKFRDMQQSIDTAGAGGAEDPETILMMLNELQNFDFAYIIGMFLIFFVLGYILYASLFAAVGAAMGDDWGEGQSITLIVTLPIIIAFYIGISVVNNPNSTMAVWASFVPIFAPVIMPARVVFDPPMWQIILSIVILVFSCIFFIWLSGRIYRVGILMYGKKTTFKEFVQWIFRKD